MIDIMPLPVNETSEVYAVIHYWDMDNDTGTVLADWLVNSVVVETDNVTSVENDSLAIVYLNASLDAGDIINISVRANDTNTSINYTWQYIIWAIGKKFIF